jgi:hypothetical protein
MSPPPASVSRVETTVVFKACAAQPSDSNPAASDEKGTAKVLNAP